MGRACHDVPALPQQDAAPSCPFLLRSADVRLGDVFSIRAPPFMEKGLRHFQMQFSIREARAGRSVLDLKVLLIKDLFLHPKRVQDVWGSSQGV